MADITPNTANPVREDAYVTELATKLGIDAKYIPKSPTWRNEEEIKVLADLFANMSAGGDSGLPDTPGSNGYYTLTIAVVSGTPTVSWVKPLVVTADGPMSSTFKEIKDAFLHGRHVYVSQSTMGNYYASIVSIYEDIDLSVYRVAFHAADGSLVRYEASSLNGYPEVMGFSGGDN